MLERIVMHSVSAPRYNSNALYHGQARAAAERRCGGEDGLAPFRARIADVFEAGGGGVSAERRALELPYQLLRLGQVRRPPGARAGWGWLTSRRRAGVGVSL